MQRTQASKPGPRGGQRRGLVSILIILAAVLLFALLGIALDLSLLTLKRRQAITSCDAASLAGAAKLMDDRVLYPHLAASDYRNAEEQSELERGLTKLRIEEAQRTAALFAARNAIGSERVLLELNPTNSPRGDLIAGYRADPTSLDEKMQVWQGEGPVNALVTRFERSRRRGNPLTMWFAKGAGMPLGDLTVESQAAVDQRVYGFRPAGAVEVPLVPLAIRCRGDELAWHEQAAASTSAAANDRFVVHEPTGAIGPGSDGIPEIVVRLGLRLPEEAKEKQDKKAGSDGLETRPTKEADEAKAGVNPTEQPAEKSPQKSVKLNSGLLSLLNTDPTLTKLTKTVQAGFSQEELLAWDGQLALTEDGGLIVPALATLDADDLAALHKVLAEIEGQKRIWPLGWLATRGEGDEDHERGDQRSPERLMERHGQGHRHDADGRRGERQFRLEGFAAGRVVACELRISAGNNDELGLVLDVFIQPCLLQTPTALVRPGQPICPWIGKLMLTH